jgi:restriction endonuclease S subunit
MMKEDWIECTFEDLLDYEQPTNYIIKEEDYNDKYPIPVLTAGKGFIKGYTKENFGVFDKVPTIIFDDFTTATQFVNFPFKVKSSAMKILVPKSDLVNLKFVYGTMQVNKVRAETHKRYWISEYSKLKVFLPPLPIQRAIVKKIEQLFSALDAGVADLKKAQEQLKVYRQAVLKKAFEGELTNDTAIKRVPLGELCEGVEYGSSAKSKERGKIPVLRMGNIQQGAFEWEDLVYTNDVAEIEKYQLNKFDVLFNRTNSPELVGKTAIYKGERPAIFAGYLIRINYKKDLLNPFYLNYYLNSHEAKVYGSTIKSFGVNQSNINGTKLKSYPIPFTSLEHQLHIVREIESRLSVCDALEQQINTSLQQSEALRQSILRKAFAGELLTQAEIATCKKEPDYEPASELLERIKRENEKDNTKTNKRTTGTKAVTEVPKISADIHAGLIAKIIKLHETNPACKDKLSHIKCEKLAHLVEYHVHVPLGRQPVKDAAGPDDYPHLKNVESRARKAGFFKTQKTPIGYTYIPGNNINKVIDKFESSISNDQNAKINELLQLFLPFDLETAEIAATTYAGWNNLIILGNSHPSDEEIVTESRENWSKRKLGIPRERFFKAINWLRKKEINLIPTGYGLLVSAPAKKKK